MKSILLMGAVFVLVGCSEKPSPDDIVTNQCERVRLAQQCLKDLPKGPAAPHYNDWDEVVNQCDSNAYYQSKRKRKHVPEECAV